MNQQINTIRENAERILNSGLKGPQGCAERIIAALAELEAAMREPVAWQGVHDRTDLYYKKPPQADVHPLYRAAPPAQQAQPTSIGELAEVIDAATKPHFEDIVSLCAQINYMVGIAERGTGSKCPDDLPPELFLLNYVKQLEAQAGTVPAKEDFCYCNEEISLQMVSGGAAPEGLYGRVTLKVNGEYVEYIKAPAQQARVCGLCGEAEAFTGKCGGGRANPKALCYEVPAQQAQPTESVLVDGIAYDTPAPVAAELLRLHLEGMQAQPITEAFIDEYLDDYEMRGEDEAGRDACYTPTEGEKALIKDAIMGLLSETEDKQPQAEAVPEMHDALCPALTGGDCTCTPPATIDKAWAQFCGGIGHGPDAPYPGMIEAFEAHYGQTFTDKDWRKETGVWAAAWKAAKAHGEAAPQQAEAVPSDVVRDAAPIPDHELVTMYGERPTSDLEMIEFAREVERRHGIGGQPQHITDGSPCWCNPDVAYTDPETGASVIVHRRPQ